MKPHLATFVLVCTLGAWSVLCAQDTRPTPTPEEAARQKEQWDKLAAREGLLSYRQDLIKKQLDDLAANPDKYPPWAREWAGTYYCGDGLGMNVAIFLGPEGDLAYTYHGCLGLYDSQIGKVREVKDDRLVFDLDTPIDEKAPRFMDDEIALVRWGDRRYLVPFGELQDFCNRVNEGFEGRYPGAMAPLKGPSRKFLAGELVATPENLPQVPAEARQWLLKEPVSATITRIDNVGVMPTGAENLQHVHADVVLDAGSSKGLATGMELSLDAGNSSTASIKLTEVNENESRGTLRAYVSGLGDRSADFLKVGLICSTSRDSLKKPQ